MIHMMFLRSRVGIPALMALVGWLILTSAAAAQNVRTPDGFQAYRLQHVDAAKVAPQLRSLLDGNAGQGEILIDRQSNRILLKGSLEAQQIADDFLRALDKPPASGHRNAGRAVNRIKAYRLPADRLETIGQRLRTRYQTNPQVRVVIDARTQQLIVAAPQTIHAKLAVELSDGNGPPNAEGTPRQPESGLRGPLGNPTTAVVPATKSIHKLQNISWREFEDQLKRVWGRSLSLSTARNGEIAHVQIPGPNGAETVMHIDRRRDEVAFKGSPASMRAWSDVTRAMDSKGQAHVVPVRKADPLVVQRAIGLMQNAVESAAGGQPKRWGGDLVSRIFQNQNQDPDGNPNVPADQPQAPEGQMPQQPGADDEEAGVIGPVQIEYVEGLGVFVVRGNRRDVARVMRLIEEIQRQSDITRPVAEVRQLRFANATAVATLIQELYEPIFEARQGPLSLTPLDKPNAILLVGSAENVKSATDLIAKLDRPIDPKSQFQVFRLKHASAIDAETTIRSFYVDRPGSADEPRPNLGTRARVIADFRTNSLIVQAAPRDMAEISFLIDQIDIERTDANTEIRVFNLKNAVAQDLVTVLREAITGQQQQQQAPPGAAVGATQAGTNQRSSNITIMGIDAEGNRIIESGILTDVIFSADATVNAVVVRGPAKSMDLVAELIRQLDQPPSTQAQIKVFEIQNGDATTLTALLQELFGQQVTAGQGTLGQAFNVQRQNVQAFAGAGDSSLIPLRFAVDVRSNSIVAAGSIGDLNVVEILLLRLDEGDIATRRTEVFFLQNAPANDVALAIQTFLSNQRAITQQLFAFSAVSPFEQIDREVIVVAEPVTNGLIVSATPRYYEQVVRIIQDLDYRPPMVMVQVVIADVALDDIFELGVELGLQDSLLFDRGLNSVGFDFPNAPLGNDLGSAAAVATRELLAGQGISSFGLGRTSGNVGYGGLVLSAANESVNILIRALQDQGRMQVLARPQVMTLDNEQAFVQVGERVSRITDTNLTPQGGSQNSFEDINTGLLLSIRPRVNNDDVVVMTLDTERSEVEDTGVTVAPGIVSPNIATQTAQTTVSARSGQTIVFAGLIQKQRAVQARRVPFVSDIPVLGHLFRFDTKIKRRSELLIFMTPHVIRDSEDIERIKQAETDRMSWCLADVAEISGQANFAGGHGLWGPEGTPTIYPDYMPTGEELPAGPRPNPTLEAIPPSMPYPNPGPPPVPAPAPAPAPVIRPALPMGAGAQVPNGNGQAGEAMQQPPGVTTAQPAHPQAVPAAYQTPWQPGAQYRTTSPRMPVQPQYQQPMGNARPTNQPLHMLPRTRR